MSFFKIFAPAAIKDKLSKTSAKIALGINQILSSKKLDQETLDNLEDLMLISDMGIEVANKIITNLKNQKFNQAVSSQELKSFLAEQISKILLPCQKTLSFDSEHKPQVIIFNGVNGSGKTTSIGKIANLLSSKNKKVMIAACDTFRAAAAEQLKIWAERSNCQIISALKDGEDPASVAYRALAEAKKASCDVLLIDTAGRLQNKKNLMDELKKINQVLKKLDSNSPHENILVLDATVGQNAKSQMEAFDELIKISGIIITKLDGSAKGGILVALADKFKKPIYAVGVGEQVTDLQEFSAEDFSRNLVGLEI